MIMQFNFADGSLVEIPGIKAFKDHSKYVELLYNNGQRRLIRKLVVKSIGYYPDMVSYNCRETPNAPVQCKIVYDEVKHIHKMLNYVKEVYNNDKE